MNETIDTSIGPIGRGDIVFYTWVRRGRPDRVEWAVVSSASSLTPNIVFGRNDQGKARAINVSMITRVQKAREQ
jgi:hypothetical protein